jgi:2-oxoglutarate dehydrogenase E2 component (dihydrolipoamide succinyltransferase)
MGLARAINDLAQRARSNKLTAEDLQGGTFSVTNYGTSGSRFQTPVIVNGQAGILGVGAIEKRPVVISHGRPLDANLGDSLAFVPMLTLGFSYDHRILDGATADAYCAAVKDRLENWT